MGLFITEDWLRLHVGLHEGSEIRLPVGARLTPAADSFLRDRRIVVKYEETPNQSGGTEKHSPSIIASESQSRQPATPSVIGRPASQDTLSEPQDREKPDGFAHLKAHTLVPKNDPRLAFRGQLDSVAAQVLWTQMELAETRGMPSSTRQPDGPNRWLSDIRSVLDNIMRADVSETPLEAVSIAGLDEQTLHWLSHHPKAFLGREQPVPTMEHGRSVLLLNLLRTKIREAELAAAVVFINRDGSVSRPDIMQALNRLSSATYVLMLLCLLRTRGKLWPKEQELRQLARR